MPEARDEEDVRLSTILRNSINTKVKETHNYVLTVNRDSEIVPLHFLGTFCYSLLAAKSYISCYYTKAEAAI